MTVVYSEAMSSQQEMLVILNSSNLTTNRQYVYIDNFKQEMDKNPPNHPYTVSFWKKILQFHGQPPKIILTSFKRKKNKKKKQTSKQEEQTVAAVLSNAS